MTSALTLSGATELPSDATAFDLRPPWNGWKVSAIFVASLLAAYFTYYALALIILTLAKVPVVQSLHSLRQGWSHPVLAVPLVRGFLSLSGKAAGLWVLYLTRGALRLAPGSFGLTTPTSKNVWTGLMTGALLIVISLIVIALERAVLHVHPRATVGLAGHHGALSLLVDLIAIAAVTPFYEEILFRGLLFTALIQRAPLWLAALTSAAVFSALHFDLYGFIMRLIVGIGLALAYYRARNLWVSIIAHATINAPGAILPNLLAHA